MYRKYSKIILFVIVMIISKVICRPSTIMNPIKNNIEAMVKFDMIRPITVPSTIILNNDGDGSDSSSSSLSIDCSRPENRLFVACALAVNCSLPENLGLSYCRHIAEDEDVALDGAMASEEDIDDDAEEMEEDIE
eukprot:jgi/Orpsp1_1/1184438/evm.model.c7180000089515.1